MLFSRSSSEVPIRAPDASHSNNSSPRYVRTAHSRPPPLISYPYPLRSRNPRASTPAHTDRSTSGQSSRSVQDSAASVRITLTPSSPLPSPEPSTRSLSPILLPMDEPFLCDDEVGCVRGHTIRLIPSKYCETACELLETDEYPLTTEIIEPYIPTYTSDPRRFSVRIVEEVQRPSAPTPAAAAHGGPTYQTDTPPSIPPLPFDLNVSPLPNPWINIPSSPKRKINWKPKRSPATRKEHEIPNFRHIASLAAPRPPISAAFFTSKGEATWLKENDLGFPEMRGPAVERSFSSSDAGVSVHSVPSKKPSLQRCEPIMPVAAIARNGVERRRRVTAGSVRSRRGGHAREESFVDLTNEPGETLPSEQYSWESAGSRGSCRTGTDVGEDGRKIRKGMNAENAEAIRMFAKDVAIQLLEEGAVDTNLRRPRFAHPFRRSISSTLPKGSASGIIGSTASSRFLENLTSPPCDQMGHPHTADFLEAGETSGWFSSDDGDHGSRSPEEWEWLAISDYGSAPIENLVLPKRRVDSHCVSPTDSEFSESSATTGTSATTVPSTSSPPSTQPKHNDEAGDLSTDSAWSQVSASSTVRSRFGGGARKAALAMKRMVSSHGKDYQDEHKVIAHETDADSFAELCRKNGVFR